MDGLVIDDTVCNWTRAADVGLLVKTPVDTVFRRATIDVLAFATKRAPPIALSFYGPREMDDGWPPVLAVGADGKVPGCEKHFEDGEPCETMTGKVAGPGVYGVLLRQPDHYPVGVNVTYTVNRVGSGCLPQSPYGSNWFYQDNKEASCGPPGWSCVDELCETTPEGCCRQYPSNDDP
jgi:hypothetical protein